MLDAVTCGRTTLCASREHLLAMQTRVASHKDEPFSHCSRSARGADILFPVGGCDRQPLQNPAFPIVPQIRHDKLATKGEAIVAWNAFRTSSVVLNSTESLPDNQWFDEKNYEAINRQYRQRGKKALLEGQQLF
ncbi:MAG: hypothetical protein H3C50_07020 [Kiritimatiellae bacterium]|nr:hypothetical protein [Kiritimatiellia bacterium]MCO5044428.1 hypothetical protein [Kiritimatiellia bacterium]MCO5068449.1 hypothetical protein [Kiritimatiellia bacterium]